MTVQIVFIFIFGTERRAGIMKNKKEKSKMHLSTLWIVLAASLAGIVVLTFSFTYSWGVRMQNIESTSSTTSLADFETETIYGEKVSNKDILGAKVTAFNVWETTCPACLGEMEALEELSRKYPAEDFRLVGVCDDLYDKNGKLKPAQVDKAKSLMDDAGTSFPNLIPTPEMTKYFKGVIAGYPTTFFVDSSGHIIKYTTGSNDLEGWTKKVDEVLENVK